MILIKPIISEKFHIISWLVAMDIVTLVGNAGSEGVPEEEVIKMTGDFHKKWIEELHDVKKYSIIFQKIKDDPKLEQEYIKHKSTPSPATINSCLTFLVENPIYSLENKLIHLIRVNAEFCDIKKTDWILAGGDIYTLSSVIVMINYINKNITMSSQIEPYTQIEKQYLLLTDHNTSKKEIEKYKDELAKIDSNAIIKLSINCTTSILDAFRDEYHIQELTRHIKEEKLIFKQFN